MLASGCESLVCTLVRISARIISEFVACALESKSFRPHASMNEFLVPMPSTS